MLLLLLLCYLTNASLEHLKAAILEESALAPGGDVPTTTPNTQADLSPYICIPVPCNPPKYCQYSSPVLNSQGCRTGCGPLSCTCPSTMEFKCGKPDQCTPKCSLPAPYCPLYNCFSGCHCKAGLIQNSQGNCVNPSQCDVCPTGQHLESCGLYSCGTCLNQETNCAWWNCGPGCFCNNGLFRNNRGQCLTATQCGNQCCDPWKEPGKNGNPMCIEGYECCITTGEWVCGVGVYNGVYTVSGCPGRNTGPFGVACAPGTAYNPTI